MEELSIKYITSSKNGLALLATTSLPMKFWLYPFQTATFLINRLPTKVLNLQSPFQIIFGKLPDYILCKVFGCLCYPYVRPYNTHNLQYRFVHGLFLSYSTIQKGYLCLEPSSNSLICHSTCYFLWNYFPISVNFSPPLSPPSCPPVSTLAIPCTGLSLQHTAISSFAIDQHHPLLISHSILPISSHSSNSSIPSIIQVPFTVASFSSPQSNISSTPFPRKKPPPYD